MTTNTTTKPTKRTTGSSANGTSKMLNNHNDNDNDNTTITTTTGIASIHLKEEK